MTSSSWLFKEWEHRDRSGLVFDSSCGFNLPNGATCAPDVSWVRKERIKSLTDEEWHRFLPLCPDLVLELRSPSDSLRALDEKMTDYIENGAQLGWLLDHTRREARIYRPETMPEILKNCARISGEPVLKGFELDVPRLWAAMDWRSY